MMENRVSRATSRKHLHPTLTHSFRDVAEVLVVLRPQRLQRIRLQELRQHLLARELVYGHVGVLVIARQLAVAPAAHGAVVAQHLRQVLLVVPLVERSLPLFGDGGAHDEESDSHESSPDVASAANGLSVLPCASTVRGTNAV